MSLTRSALLTLAAEMADAVDQPRWGATLRTQLLGEAHWREWRDLLNIDRHLRMAARTVTTDADGRIDKASLNSGSGDSTETMYRILSVNQGNVFYQSSAYEQYPLAPAEGRLPQVWYEYGDQIQLMPAIVGNSVTVTVNHLPQRADLLASDSSLVVFPDGYELILAFELAASMFMKGAAETQQAAEFLGRAQALRDRMHQDIARRSTRPLRLNAADDRYDWGSVS
jgi:hypothetical protein